jgi:enoyl-CoA hydratase
VITVEQLDDGLAEVRLDDGRVNALDLAAVRRLAQTFRSLTGSAVLLTAAGRAFCAGVDLRPVAEGGRAYVEQFIPALDQMFLAVFDHPRPVLAAVQGHALAGGCILTLAADRRLMSAGTIGVTELAVGVPFPPSAFETLRMVAGPRTAELILTMARLDPDQALAAGIVDQVVPAEQLRDRALAAVRQLAAVPPATFEYTKHQLRDEVRARIERDTVLHQRTLIEAWSSEPVLAGIRGYLDRLARR